MSFSRFFSSFQIYSSNARWMCAHYLIKNREKLREKRRTKKERQNDRMFANLHNEKKKCSRLRTKRMSHQLYINYAKWKWNKKKHKHTNSQTRKRCFFDRITKTQRKKGRRSKEKNFIWFLILSWFCTFSVHFLFPSFSVSLSLSFSLTHTDIII